MSAANASQIHEAYERAFRSLLWRLQCDHLQTHVERLQGRVGRLEQKGLSTLEAHRRVLRTAAAWVRKRLGSFAERQAAQNGSPRSGAAVRLAPLLKQQLDQQPFLSSPDFHCDASMGGLARWLRGAGYDAAWWPDVDDDELIRKTLESSAILLTTDRPLYRRAAIAHGLVPAVLVPVALKKREQFALVVERLGLPRKPPRCMSCGGRLEPVAKTEVRERIPPRTYPWLDEYYRCQRCDKLYWPGTHWEKIDEHLRRSSPPAS